jgi:hypothetical protein
MKIENLLKNLYIILMALLFTLIVLTPLLVSQGIYFLSEEPLEAIIIFILFVVGLFIYSLYKKNLEQKEIELNQTLNYIGAVNLQVSQIKSIFDTFTRYPENKKDFKYLFESLADKALAGVNGDWVLFRIIDMSNGKTLTEYAKARGPAVLLKYEVGNKDLMENKNSKGCWIVSSMQENFSIKAFCIMPIESINENQEVLLRAIVNNLGMLYLIFESEAVKPWQRPQN